jgi:hypothetical protein
MRTRYRSSRKKTRSELPCRLSPWASCSWALILLYAFFRLLGVVLHRFDVLARVKAIKAIRKQAHKVTVMAKQGLETKGIDKEIYVAVIAMALQEYEENVHDVEPGIITIIPEDRPVWHNEVPDNPAGPFVL